MTGAARAAVVALAGAAVAGGCGSSSSRPSTTAAAAHPRPIVERAYGKGADRVWVFERQGQQNPRAVVVFLHGLYDQVEATPLNHLDWLHHLASKGDAVLYPQYEATPGAAGAVFHALKGIVTGMRAVNPVVNVPVVFIGYSRGGGMAFDLAGAASAVHVKPRAVVSVFPALLDPPANYSLIPGSRILFLVGDRDTNVSHVGRDQIVHYLRAVGYPQRLVHTRIVHSTPAFTADHFSAMGDSTAVHTQIWAPADRLVDAAIRGN
jgi:predicted esterase